MTIPLLNSGSLVVLGKSKWRWSDRLNAMLELMMETSDRENILIQIAEVEKQLTKLHQQQETAETTLRLLRERLAQYDNENACQAITPFAAPVPAAANLTPEDKVALFLRLFRGREDVYPKLWHNKKTDKKGYSPQ